MTIRLALIIVISILVVWERWRRTHESHSSAAITGHDIGTSFLYRFRCSYHGDE